jgi:hypothetical protein
MKETETLHKKECFSSEYDMLIDLLNQYRAYWLIPNKKQIDWTFNLVVKQVGR